MSGALAVACEKMGLLFGRVPPTRSPSFVELAESGIHDFESLLAATLERFSPPNAATNS
jgi:hypothetical protein